MHNPPTCQTVVRTPFEIYLNTYRKMASAGAAVAIPGALHLCQQWKAPVPNWLLDAAIELLCELLKNEKPTRRGRTPTHVARARQDTIDYSRWSTVKWQRDAQKDLQEQVEVLRLNPDLGDAARREDRERHQEWLGTTLERAFECASMVLEGTTSFGSPDAIKRSYFKVERAFANETQRCRYYAMDPQLLKKLGIPWEPLVRPGRKIEPLWKLSLGRN